MVREHWRHSQLLAQMKSQNFKANFNNNIDNNKPLLKAAQNNAIKTNYLKAKTDNM